MQRLLSHPLMILLSTGIAVAIWISLWHNQAEIRDSRSLVTNVEDDLAAERKEVESLQTQLDQASTPLAQERLIRDQLLMQKPGEYLLQIPEVTPEPVQTATAAATTTIWQEWQALLLQE